MLDATLPASKESLGRTSRFSRLRVRRRACPIPPTSHSLLWRPDDSSLAAPPYSGRGRPTFLDADATTTPHQSRETRSSGLVRLFTRGSEVVIMRATARFIIEVADLAAGVVVRERSGFRFFASDRRMQNLDSRFFRSLRAAELAVERRTEDQRSTSAATSH